MVTPLSHGETQLKTLAELLRQLRSESRGLIGAERVKADVKVGCVAGTVIAVALATAYAYLKTVLLSLDLGLAAVILNDLIVLGAYDTIVDVMCKTACPAFAAAYLVPFLCIFLKKHEI